MGLCRRKGGDLPGDAAVKGDEIHDGGGHEGPGAVFGRIEAGGTPRAIEHSGSFLVIPTNMPADVFLQSRAAHKSGVETTFRPLTPYGNNGKITKWIFF